MRHILGSDRAQTLLLPASVEDYVGADNPVRAIEAFVDGFDLRKAGFVRAEAKETGRPGYHPGDLLKLYLYGYLNPRAFQPAVGSGVPPQLGGDLALARAAARLQDDCRLPARETRRPSRPPFAVSCISAAS